MSEQSADDRDGLTRQGGQKSPVAVQRSIPFRAGQRVLSVLGLLIIAGALFSAGLGLGIWFGDKPKDLQNAAVKGQGEQSASLNIAVVDRDRPAISPPPSFQPPNPPVKAAPPSVLPEPTQPKVVAIAPVAAAHTSRDGWLRNAVKLPLQDDGRPLIAIVIDDMGVARRRSQRAAALPAPLTMAFLPYADDVAQQAAAARAVGHELLVHIPMQPMGFNSDPGPNVLDAKLGSKEVDRRLKWNLSQFSGYIGFNNHMGSQFTANQESMSAVMAVAHKRGLLFLDSRTSPQSVGFETARDLGVTAATRDIFLDNIDSVEEVEMRLLQTMAQARVRGSAIAIGHPRDSTIKVLEKWLPKIRTEGFQLAPLSAVVLKREALRRKQANVSNN